MFFNAEIVILICLLIADYYVFFYVIITHLWSVRDGPCKAKASVDCIKRRSPVVVVVV